MQAYALQCYLEGLGFENQIIDYKPSIYDYTLVRFLRNRDFLHFSRYIRDLKRERSISRFRKAHLRMTNRVRWFCNVADLAADFDVIISGSDQVLNPYFLLNGEGSGKSTPIYFLGFPFGGKKIAYAVSFGCEIYPPHVHALAKEFVGAFDFISVREKSGMDIINSLGREDVTLAPDPTLLLPSSFYRDLADRMLKRSRPYVYAFFIRHINERKQLLAGEISNLELLWNNEDGDYSLESWLSKILHADFVITDSFHCVVMCLKFHRPFVVVTELEGKVGMNDRFYTLLGELALESRIVYKCEINMMPVIMGTGIDWDKVDNLLDRFVMRGKVFLDKTLVC